jgi:Skp family chaperone for outer membrane proteins
MKYLARALVLATAVTLLFSGSAQAQVRSIGTIDLKKVFDGYWKTKQASVGLKDRAADMEKEHKNMLDDYRKAREDYQALLTAANDQAISPEEKEKRKKSAEDKLKYLKDQEDVITQYERQARTTLDEQQRRMRDNILTEIRNIVNAKAKAANYNLVIDTSAETAGGTPIVAYINSPESDITAEVLKELNASAPADALKTDTKAEEKDGKKDEKKAEKK